MGDAEENEFEPEYVAELELDADTLFGDFDESDPANWVEKEYYHLPPERPFSPKKEFVGHRRELHVKKLAPINRSQVKEKEVADGTPCRYLVLLLLVLDLDLDHTAASKTHAPPSPSS
jgi:hypothetical protein